MGLLILCRLHRFLRAFATARLASGCSEARSISCGWEQGREGGEEGGLGWVCTQPVASLISVAVDAQTSMCPVCCFNACEDDANAQESQMVTLLKEEHATVTLALQADLSHNVLVKPFNYLPWCQVDIREVSLHTRIGQIANKAVSQCMPFLSTYAEVVKAAEQQRPPHHQLLDSLC